MEAAPISAIERNRIAQRDASNAAAGADPFAAILDRAQSVEGPRAPVEAAKPDRPPTEDAKAEPARAPSETSADATAVPAALVVQTETTAPAAPQLVAATTPVTTEAAPAQPAQPTPPDAMTQPQGRTDAVTAPTQTAMVIDADAPVAVNAAPPVAQQVVPTQAAAMPNPATQIAAMPEAVQPAQLAQAAAALAQATPKRPGEAAPNKTNAGESAPASAELKTVTASLRDAVERVEAAEAAAGRQNATADSNAQTPNVVAADAKPAAAPQVQAQAQAQTIQAAQPATPASPAALAPTPVSASVDASSPAPGAHPLGTTHAAKPTPASQIAAGILRRFDGRTTSFEMRLDPADLGRVDVRLEVSADRKVKATVAAESTTTLAELVRAARDLERALNESGLDLADNGVQFSLTPQNDNSAFADARSQWAEAAGRGDEAGAGDASTPTRVAAQPLSISRWSGARVDVWA